MDLTDCLDYMLRPSLYIIREILYRYTCPHCHASVQHAQVIIFDQLDMQNNVKSCVTVRCNCCFNVGIISAVAASSVGRAEVSINWAIKTDRTVAPLEGFERQKKENAEAG